MNYIGMICPGCKQAFTDTDDVVVCPECGTPQHRACYFKANECVNIRLHGTNFTWTPPYDPVAEAKKKAEEEARQKEQQNQQSSEDQGGGFFGNVYGGYTQYKEGESGANFGPNVRVLEPKEKLGDYTVEEWGKAIGKKHEYYVPRFFAMDKANRKISVNFMAFLFPVAWAFYRKMYKFGALLLAVSLLLPVLSMHSIAEYYTEYFDIYMEYAMSDPEETEAASERASERLADLQVPAVLTVNSYVTMALSVIWGLLANYLYRLHLEKIMKKAKESTDPEAVYKKSGGTSWLWCILGLVAESVLLSVVIWLGSLVSNDIFGLIGGLFK